MVTSYSLGYFTVLYSTHYLFLLLLLAVNPQKNTGETVIVELVKDAITPTTSYNQNNPFIGKTELNVTLCFNIILAPVHTNVQLGSDLNTL